VGGNRPRTRKPADSGRSNSNAQETASNPEAAHQLMLKKFSVNQGVAKSVLEFLQISYRNKFEVNQEIALFYI
jgi:hypothetical protein